MLIQAFAKINWSLDITGIRPDGFHLMDMVMQPVSLSDEISLLPSSGISLETDGYPVSRADESNLAWKAAAILREKTGTGKGVRIRLHKRIPMGAGMGGGSADAAAVLYGLNRLWNLHLSPSELEKIGLTLGADIPFCLHGGLARVQGIGEMIEEYECVSNYRLLVIQPCRGLSTKEIFKLYDSSCSPYHPKTELVLASFANHDSAGLSGSMFNVLEPVSSLKCPEISIAVEELKEAGAFAAQMTGSGSAVFGAFRSSGDLEKALSCLSKKYRNIYSCHSQSDSLRIVED
jgi:4-diphosphocytidyl-2-C-methyl-D-erythritol kinase